MKFLKHNRIKKILAENIFNCIQSLYPDEAFEIDDIYKLLTPPPKANMGEIAFGCFILAKKLKLAPNVLSNTLQEKIDKIAIIKEAKSFGPYLNFFLDFNIIAKEILEPICSKEFFNKAILEKAPKTIIEFSQPNTHKEMHVGHMRNLCFGDALIKIYKYCGVETIATTFPGDVGTHVAKCLWYFKHHNSEIAPEKRKGAWLGTLYTKGNNLLEEQKGSEKEDENRKALTQILKEIEAKNGPYFDLWEQTRQWSIEQMKEVYSWAHVEFDHWYWESDVDSDSVKLINQYFDQGLFIKDQGAIGIDLSEEKLGFCLLLKSDGTGLYATKDIELARRKFDEHKVEKSLYVVDNRQSLHFKQVFCVLDKMGFENAKNCEHLQYEMVELSDGAMSSRKGNIVPLQALIDQMVSKIKNDYLAKYQESWSAEQIDHTANIVAAGAIKFGMTRIDSNKKIVFNMDEWLKLDGESGPYIQYVHARICSMLTKIEIGSSIDFSSLTHPLEHALIIKLSEFNDVIEQCLIQNKTHLLCSYLYELARGFNSFYAECSVLKAQTENLKHARAVLCQSIALSLKQGLLLLGIEAPTRM